METGIRYHSPRRTGPRLWRLRLGLNVRSGSAYDGNTQANHTEGHHSTIYRPGGARCATLSVREGVWCV